MASEYDLYMELQEKVSDLDKAVRSIRKNGQDKAQTERDYKVLLKQECLKLRNEGMAIGMIDKTCYGIPEVADARMKRDIAEAVYTANLEAINSIKLQLRLIESQIQREWNQS